MQYLHRYHLLHQRISDDGELRIGLHQQTPRSWTPPHCCSPLLELDISKLNVLKMLETIGGQSGVK